MSGAGPSRRGGGAGFGHRENSLDADFSKGQPLPVTCSGDELARLFGIGDRHLRALADEGHVVKTGRATYERDASITRYVTHLRNVAAGRGGDEHVATLTAERARLAREQADNWARRNAAADRELLPAAQVERRWQEILAGIRSRLLTVPSRVRQRAPHLSATDVATVDREVRDALTEAADAGGA